MNQDIRIPLVKPTSAIGPTLSLSLGSESTISLKTPHGSPVSNILPLTSKTKTNDRKGLQFQPKAVNKSAQKALEELFYQSTKGSDEQGFHQKKKIDNIWRKTVSNDALFDFNSCVGNTVTKPSHATLPLSPINAPNKMQNKIIIRDTNMKTLPGDIRLQETSKHDINDADIMKCSTVNSVHFPGDIFAASKQSSRNIDVIANVLPTAGLQATRQLRRYKVGISPLERVKLIQANLNEYSRTHSTREYTNSDSVALDMTTEDITQKDKYLSTNVFPSTDFPSIEKPLHRLTAPAQFARLLSASPPLSPSSMTSEGSDTNGPGYENIVNEYLSDTNTLSSSLTPASEELLRSLAAAKPSPMVPEKTLATRQGMVGTANRKVPMKSTNHTIKVNEHQSKAAMISLIRMVAPPQTTLDPLDPQYANHVVEHVMMELPQPGRKTSLMDSSSSRMTDSTDVDFESKNSAGRGDLITPWTALSGDPPFSHSFLPNDLPEFTIPEFSEGDELAVGEEVDVQNADEEGKLIFDGEIGTETRIDSPSQADAIIPEAVPGRTISADAGHAVTENDDVSLLGTEEDSAMIIDETQEYDSRAQSREGGSGRHSALSRVSFLNDDDDDDESSAGIRTPRIPPITNMPEIATSPLAQFGIDPTAYGVRSPGNLFCSLCPRDATLWCQGCSQAYCPCCWGRVGQHSALGQAELWGHRTANARRKKAREMNLNSLNVTLGPGGQLLPGPSLVDRYEEGLLKRTLSFPRRITGSMVAHSKSKVLDFEGTGGTTSETSNTQDLAQAMTSLVSSGKIPVANDDNKRGYFAGNGGKKIKNNVRELPGAGKAIYLKPSVEVPKSKAKLNTKPKTSPAIPVQAFMPEEWPAEAAAFSKPGKPIEILGGVTIYTK